MYSSATTSPNTGLSALVKLIVFGREPNYFSPDELNYIDDNSKQSEKLNKDEQNETLKKPSRVRKMKNSLTKFGEKLNFKTNP